MRIQFIKNVHFTKLVKISGRNVKEFNFRKMRSGEEDLFSVDVSDDRGNRIMFQMRKEGSTWNIAEQVLPAWITEQEQKLNEIIEEELRSPTS
ncbi:hypothetical protein I5907_16485 [Panacibacter sp. DH6]|uniref:Uncharacterized protein n=1 Tax=Panacibacter microcysteis TaxID=2793269 RepID=A0A931E9V6_9BACT|nr:hypothetical protein [Panacibacter microcysteis]MBG9377839.1 hypothetical protein [Panacibacter microcysteis]